MKDQNPIDHMRFYVKDNLHKAVKVRKDQVSYYMCASIICISTCICDIVCRCLRCYLQRLENNKSEFFQKNSIKRALRQHASTSFALHAL